MGNYSDPFCGKALTSIVTAKAPPCQIKIIASLNIYFQVGI